MKNSGETGYSPVYFNSLTKAVIGSNKFGLNQVFQEIIYRLGNWISNGSGWIAEEIYSQYVNVSLYLPFSGSIYIKLPYELNHPMKGMINIKNHVNLNGAKLCRIKKEDREVLKKLNY